MALELTEAFIKDNGLSPEQAAAVTTYGNTYADTEIATVKKTYETKAHDDAQGILNGASDKIAADIKIVRNQGEKAADYIIRAQKEFFATSQTGLDAKIKEYDEKVANFKGDEATKAELVKAKEALETIQQNTVDFDKFKTDSENYATLVQDHASLKNSWAIGQVKPAFPETINSYEANAKWDEVIGTILKDGTLEIVEGVAMVINKDNKFKTDKLADLVNKNETIVELMKGRQQVGPNGKPLDKIKVEGVPFDVPKENDSAIRSKLINNWLEENGFGFNHPQRTEKFKELNTKILENNKK